MPRSFINTSLGASCNDPIQLYLCVPSYINATNSANALNVERFYANDEYFILHEIRRLRTVLDTSKFTIKPLELRGKIVLS